jgi:SAM-dependent methyltransferase
VSISLRAVQWLLALCFALAAGAAAAAAAAPKPFVPITGQAGKDVIWVPTPFALIEKMLDMAEVTPEDFVMDLGSGDGRNIIAAAKRGARGLGVEFNPDMVELSKRTAAKEGVSDLAKFTQGDMYEADISRATVLALFLLPENLERLKPKFLELQPGARIVMNGFAISGWNPDATEQIEGDCDAWCTALLYVVPAKVAGRWRLPAGELAIEQKYQTLSGTFVAGGACMPVTNARLRGERISFTANGFNYVGRVDGDTMSGTMEGGASGAWSAVRAESNR